MKYLLINLFIAVGIGLTARVAEPEPELVAYKRIDTVSLHLKIYYPAEIEENHRLPAMVFFHGGGWMQRGAGGMKQFEQHAEHYSDRGIVCFLAQYRVRNMHGSTPFESLMDAKSAIRYIKENGQRFHIDTSRIIAAGGSAGGHLAAATALIRDFNDPSDNPAISPVPDALVLFNPVIDNGPGGYGYERIGDAYREFSPLHNIREGAPPTIFFLGTEDTMIPVETAEYYRTVMEKVGSRCDLHLYEGKGHGFFNYRNRDNYDRTLQATDHFLVSLGFIEN
jgi:acetyl esterase/lipase